MATEILPPLEAEPRIRSGYLYLVTFVAAVGGFLFGYDLSLISGAVIFLKAEWNLSPGGLGMVTGSAILGCPFGPLAGVWLADRFGRNKTLLLSALLFIVSAIGSALARGMLDFSFWRFVGGIGVGLASTVSPMYIAELAPARLRGRLVVVNQLAIVVGLSLSVYVSWLLSFGEHWRWMFATMALPAAILLVGLFFVPNSPRWLAARGDFPGALAILAWINGRTQAERELAEIREELGTESGAFRELWQPGVRRALVIGLLLMVLSQINGVNMILLYTPTLFMEAGISHSSDAILNSVYVTWWITLCTLVAFWLTAQFGRRPILIVGTIGMAAGHVLMFLRFTYALPTAVTLAGIFLATGAFTLTLAPLSWVILSEIFPNRVRGKAMSLCTLAMFAASYATTNVFPVILDAFKRQYGNPGGTFLIFMGVCLSCSLFVYLTLPETKDKSLEEIGRFWLQLDNHPRAVKP
jgi:sugar porter (SP) family MFS transporter